MRNTLAVVGGICIVWLVVFVINRTVRYRRAIRSLAGLINAGCVTQERGGALYIALVHGDVEARAAALKEVESWGDYANSWYRR